MNHIPVKRNWLDEAYDIASGKLKISPKKEHLVAAIGALDHLAKNTNKMRGLMKSIVDEANKVRQKKGLPPIGAPE